jgi:hypothetical protein
MIIVHYCLVFFHEKQENMAILEVHAFPYRHSGTVLAGIQNYAGLDSG